MSALQPAEYFESSTQSGKTRKRGGRNVRSKAINGIEKNGLAVQMRWSLKYKTSMHQKELQKQLKQFA